MPAPPAKKHYLEAKILTASQPQLQLMLLEGAVRFGRQAQQAWEEPSPEANVFLDRTFDLVEALVCGASQGKEEISKQIEEQYAFLFRELAACQIDHDVEKLESVLELLEYERETWKQACALWAADSTSEGASADENLVARQPVFGAGPAVPKARTMGGLPATHGGLSLEA